MKPLALEDIAPLAEYETLRQDYREAVIAHKRHRRVPVGDKVTLVFEDRETLRFQIQEMLRIERTTRQQDVQHELDTYNELMPGPHELSATLFVEITEQPQIRPELERLIGINEHVFLALGEGDDATRVHAHFDPKQIEEERISAVQYIRFPLGAHAERFADPSEPAALEIDHPNYQVHASLTGPVRASLIATCLGTCPSLMHRSESVGDDPDAPRASERVAVREDGAGGLYIEALEPGARLEAADPNLSAELWQALQECVRDRVGRGQHCEVLVEAGESVEGIRFHLRSRTREPAG